MTPRFGNEGHCPLNRMCCLAVDGAHRREEGFPGAVIGEIDGGADADAEKCEYELPGMSPQIGKAGAIECWCN